MSAPPMEPGLHRRLGLTDDELDAIGERLGRPPNDLELAVFSVMWSEHCSYKSSKPVLGLLPSAGDGVLAGPGENAGVISIGDGLAVAFKIESHNHPSAVEPYQGAATGVGGILRDIVAMGARPIAVLDALRFGDPDDPGTWRTVDGVVGGIGGYGNCVGIPTVGGELAFHPAYRANPLVNVMAVGLLRPDMLSRGRADGPGNLVVLYGATTGRDGIGGASVLASAALSDDDQSKRPSVQIGDPFVEKLLLEVTIELVARRLVEGVQDLGAGGISCAVSEMADRAGTGIVVDLDAVPRREAGMAPWEVLISESQERMCAIVRPDRLDDVLEICRRWGLPSAAVIGHVTDDGQVTVVHRPGGREDRTSEPEVLGRIPSAALVSQAIVHHREARPGRPAPAPGPGSPAVPPADRSWRAADPGAVLLALLGRPGLGSVGWVTERYDATVGGDTVAARGGGAAVLRVHGTSKGLAVAVDANPGVSALDPYLGAALSVAEATRNVALTGARPLGVTDCLNFGDPTRPEEFWAFREAVRGIADACRALGLPVVGGNVSFYNESPAGPILPTPQVGVVGLLDDVTRRVDPAFVEDGDVVALVGDTPWGLAGSAFAEFAGPAADDRLPTLDLGREAAIQRFVCQAAATGVLLTAQDVGMGGLAVALAEMAVWGDRGAVIGLDIGPDPVAALFGEGPSRVLVAVRSADVEPLRALAGRHDLPIAVIGLTGGPRLVVNRAGATTVGPVLDLGLDDLRDAWGSAIPRLARVA